MVFVGQVEGKEEGRLSWARFILSMKDTSEQRAGVKKARRWSFAP
jgi:hypothetical protein